jgi:hydrogenase nickel incorporation protein HypB
VGAEVIGIEEREISQAHLGELIGKAKAFPLDVLLVECARPAGVAGGVNVGVFSVSGGDDKPMKYPEIVQRADVVLLNKIDLMPHVAFNATLFEDEVKELNDRAPLLKLSAKCAVTLTGWIEWLGAQGVRVRSQYEVPGATIPGFYCG